MHSDDESNPNQPEEESRTSHGCQPPIINSISFPFHRNDAVTSHQTFGSEIILQDNNMTRQSISREHAAVIRDWVSHPGLPSWSPFREMMSESVRESDCGSIPRDRIVDISIVARLSGEMIRRLFDCTRMTNPIPTNRRKNPEQVMDVNRP